MKKLKMKSCNIILAEKQKQMLALVSGKIDKYEFFTVQKILPPDEKGVIEQAKFAYSFAKFGFPKGGKAFEKETKTIKEQGKASGSFEIFNKKRIRISSRNFYKKYEN